MAHPVWPDPLTFAWTVYWLYNDNCICPERHGYVGVTAYWPWRLHKHKKEDFKDRPDLLARILFEGTKAECYALELVLRPRPLIGWNQAIGGGLAGQLKGLAKPPDQRAKMSIAAKRRSSDPAERARLIEMSKKGVLSRDQSGPNNPMFGKHHSAITKQKISLANRGHRPQQKDDDQSDFDL